MLRIVPPTVPRVGRSDEHFPDGFELHLLPALPKLTKLCRRRSLLQALRFNVLHPLTVAVLRVTSMRRCVLTRHVLHPLRSDASRPRTVAPPDFRGDRVFPGP